MMEFTTDLKNMLNNKNLSLKAKGLYLYLLCVGPNENLRMKDIVKNSVDGIESIRSGFRELKKYGYLIINQTNGEDGQFVYNFQIFSKPVTDSTPLEKVEPINNINININNKYINNTRVSKEIKEKKNIKKKKFSPLEFCPFYLDEKFQEIWKEWHKSPRMKKCSSSDRALKTRVETLMLHSKGDIELAKKIVIQSCDGGWTKLYELKNNNSGFGSNSDTSTYHM